MRKLSVLLIAALICAVGIVAVTASSNSKQPTGVSAGITRQQNVQQQITSTTADLPRTIDGKNNPELVPDDVAYLMMFRLIADRHTEDEKNSIRAYLREAGFGKQNCEGCPETGGTDADIESIIAAAEEFHQEMSALDNQANNIKDRTWPNPAAEAISELRQLQTQHDSIVAKAAASLPSRLTPAGVVTLQKHINQRVKRGIKISPGPSTLPGGPDWRYAAPTHDHHQHR